MRPVVGKKTKQVKKGLKNRNFYAKALSNRALHQRIVKDKKKAEKHKRVKKLKKEDIDYDGDE